jgi:hypothetical protein
LDNRKTGEWVDRKWNNWKVDDDRQENGKTGEQEGKIRKIQRTGILRQ